MVPIVTIDLSIYSIWPVIDKIFFHKEIRVPEEIPVPLLVPWYLDFELDISICK